MITPKEKFEYIEEIKKSKFIVRLKSVQSVDEAITFINEVKEPLARHNCWAYKVGNEYRFSDDGEPSGTAGKPIYTSIDNLFFDHVVVVTTRYFGGIKLGAGGLIRAYGGTAATALKNAKSKEIEYLAKIKIDSPFDFLNKVHLCIKKYKINKVSEFFNEYGCSFEILISRDLIEEFKKELQNLTRGHVVVKNLQ